jgi:hypothetical protein
MMEVFSIIVLSVATFPPNPKVLSRGAVKVTFALPLTGLLDPRGNEARALTSFAEGFAWLARALR